MTGGVVPEVAARSHANAIFPCLDDVLSQSGIHLDQIDYIACTEKPGLLPSLLTGMTVAQTIWLALKKPIIWVDHIESHIFANYLERSSDDIIFPAVVLTVSGGHTELYYWKDRFTLKMIWQTRDDAAGESFDKVSKMLGLWFPGGAKIAKLAQLYRDQYPTEIQNQKLFPEVLLEKDSLDFSFSGIKTAVKREIDAEMQKSWDLSDLFRQYIAYEFEETVTNILAKKLIRALDQTGAKMMLLAGGVSANSRLKSKIETYSALRSVRFLAPYSNIYSMDNAAMVGIRAFYEILSKVN